MLTMAPLRLLLIVSLTIGWPAVSAFRFTECDPGGMYLICLLPITTSTPIVMSFMFSDGNYSGLITESNYDSLCSIAENITSCHVQWLKKCAPAEAQDNLQILSRSTEKVFEFCNQTDSYPKVIKVARCMERAVPSVQTCVETVEDSIPEELRYRSIHDVGERGQRAGFYKIKNLQQHMCCGINKFKSCIAPDFRSICTAEEMTEMDNLENKILQAFECTDTMYHNCNETFAAVISDSLDRL